MSREQAINLVNIYDNAYPEIYIQDYLDYFEMSKKEFDIVLDKWVNKNLFSKDNGIWQPIFNVGEEFIV